ncbi:thiol:disulfide interchange protein [Hephaestia caeni]|uniref:Thiol:disulfide interchange protein n=1 Tax=Hephaestia caeni TaxID=645617 RepID=A0A397PN51_9SPHN|nr:thioredoxin family protein [Hephaestia caeni]RIA47171.1 thiol:disulfide interchange protein [Hephaestia caeni]
MTRNSRLSLAAWPFPTFVQIVLLRMLAAILLLWLALAGVQVMAQPAQHIRASLYAQSDAPKPGGKTRLAIRMTPEHGWHGYWINPGDSGLSVDAQWHLPEGVHAGPLEHPVPELLELAGLASYVHKGAFTLLADLEIDNAIAQGTALPISVDLSWLACSDALCVPERATLQLALTAGDGGADQANLSLFSAAESALPSRAVRGSLRAADGRWAFIISGVEALDTNHTLLFPQESGWFEAGARQHVTRQPDGTIRIEVAAAGPAPAAPFTGVIADGRQSVAIADIKPDTAENPLAATESESAPAVVAPLESIPPAMASPDPATPATGDMPALWIALGGALLGGLLLNLMPCVFPILSLKALSLTKAGVDRRAAKVEGIAYFAGSVATTFALGAILVSARLLGHDIGWSFQLQNPHIILLLMLLSLAIALNLAGLFEIRGISIAHRAMAAPGWPGAFGTGALAALIATPCSGPFMGVALGAALVLPAPQALAVFAGLGIGMALPFLAIAFIPALQRLLPKPGAWMETFRRILALPMLLTAIGLAWVLGRQSGVDGLSLGLLLSALAGVGLWWAGLRQNRGRSARAALLPVAAALLLAVGLDLPRPALAAPSRADANVEPFSEQRLAELQTEGRPVFVDMTADWCLVCQVNQRVAIDRPDTRAAFEKGGVVTLVGDWTQGDPAITRFLASRGRNSIPYYLFVTPSGEVRELPQILTSDLLVRQAEQSGQPRL